MKKIVAGILLSLVAMMSLGTVALASPPPGTETSCVAHCAVVFGGDRVSTMAQLDNSGPGISETAQASHHWH